ncbi:MAG: hypothetical protein ABH840_01695, partial [Nanoarchaeota archaeon]
NFTYPSDKAVFHGGIFRELPEATTECSKDCRIEIPETFIGNVPTMEQDTKIAVFAKIVEDGEEINNKTTERYTPYLDLEADRFKAMNIIEDNEKILVVNKTLGVRAWVNITSFVRKINGDGSTTKINEYIDSVNNTKIDIYFDNKLVKSVQAYIVRYYDKNEMINLVINPSAPIEKRREAMFRLLNEKNGKTSVNIQELFPPKDKVGKMEIIVKVNPDFKINEFSVAKNQMFDDYTLKRQYKPLNVMYFRVDYISGSIIIPPRTAPGALQNSADNGLKLLLELFPLDPTKVNPKTNGTAVTGWFPVYISEGQMSDLINPKASSKSARTESYKQLQKMADKVGLDIVYGIVNETALNYENSQGILGMVSSSYSRKVALINEQDTSPGNMLHETGHLFIFPFEEPSKNFCDDPTNNFYRPSADSWCLDQKTGKRCFYYGGNPWGINVNIFDWPDSQGCFDQIDDPIGVDTSNFPPAQPNLGHIKPDIMNSAGQLVGITSLNYNTLKQIFLVN